jgi:FkbM family methyltransferase
MRRPLLLRLLPDRLRLSAWARLYQPAAAKWRPLYRAAPLRFAPGVVMDLSHGDRVSDCIAFTGVYELPLTRHLLRLARRGGTLIDVGANLGYFTLLWAAANPANRVFAFEASPRNIEWLARNVAMNQLDRRVRVIPRAAGREPGALRFDPGPADQTGWGGFAEAGPIAVDVVRVDQAAEYPPEITLLKVDIEGADAWALMGCEHLLRERRVKQVWFEQNKPRMRGLGIREDEAQQFLRSVGYEARPQSDPRGEIVDWSATPA